MYIPRICLCFKRTNLFDIRSVFISTPILTLNKVRCYCDQKAGDSFGKPLSNKNKSNDSKLADSLEPGLETKYTIFQDADAPILLDVYEEKMQQENISEEPTEEFDELNVEHGIAGVFDVEDLVELLRRDKAEDIFVAELPPEARYVDHIVIVTGRSRRHMIAIAEMVRRMFKKKRFPTDIIPRIEGENSSIWMAMDLGNIALHIFSRDARNVYDLETLWSVGTEYDSLSNSVDDPLIALLKKHSISLSDVSSKGQLL